MDARAQKLHVRGLDMTVARQLVQAGYALPHQICEATDQELLAVRGIGPATLRDIRELFPKR